MDIPMWLVRAGVAALAHTWRIRTVDEHHLHDARATGRGIVFAFWHARMVPLFWRHRFQSIAMVVSAHQDGRYLSDAARHWGYRIVEGSSSRGGKAALRRAIAVLQDGGEVVLTPDGPRGPAEVAKFGAVRAAQASCAVIVPVAARAWRDVRLKSWDRFSIPLPFTRVTLSYGEPFSVTGGRDEIPAALEELQMRIEAVTLRADSAPW